MKDDDELIKVTVTDGTKNIILGTNHGYAVSFNETSVRSMGRTATGVRGARLRDGDFIIGMDILEEGTEVLALTEKGYGKRTAISEYAIKGRGGKGVKTVNVTKKNGKLVGLATVNDEDDIMVITDTGVMIRFHAKDVSQTGRATLGVRLIRLDEDSFVSTMAIVEPEDADDEEEIVDIQIDPRKDDETLKTDMQDFGDDILADTDGE